jgi:hypothetical protein
MGWCLAMSCLLVVCLLFVSVQQHFAWNESCRVAVEARGFASHQLSFSPRIQPPVVPLCLVRLLMFLDPLLVWLVVLRLVTGPTLTVAPLEKSSSRLLRAAMRAIDRSVCVRNSCIRGEHWAVGVRVVQCFNCSRLLMFVHLARVLLAVRSVVGLTIFTVVSHAQFRVLMWGLARDLLLTNCS